MKKLFITKESLEELVKNLKKDCDEFIAPKKEHLDDIVFSDTKHSGGELSAYEGNSVVSPRAFLLPQTEEVFKIISAKGAKFKAIEEKTRRIFYGVRPCDMKAITLMRDFFADKFVDAFYEQKMERSIFIAIACASRCSKKSFCYEMDSGPVAKDGFDIELTPVKMGYLVDIGSKKGSKILKKNNKLFTKASSGAIKEAKAILERFGEAAKRIDYKKLARIMAQDKVKQSIWDDMGLRCVACSGCITLCPTCSCFSFMDRLENDRGARLRYCDGCIYAGFTRMAGGSAPIPNHKDHIRRFFEHKLNIDTLRYGRPSCVGCARCIEICPGNIDIRKFIEAVTKGAE
ncbi:MAG: 4Fe-4S dicluster domain-containing protein [Candidatus Omnitrophota bacterium]|nr:4Fe-4S dicluster domain-containing protein [Candidatus Omnitrophota bacterium]